MRLTKHPDAGTMTRQVSSLLADICREALAERGTASLVLAGGSTPLPIYQELAKEPLDWRSIQLIPGDDRWVPVSEDASNRRALAECFAAANARILPLVPDQPGEEPELSTAEDSLSRIAGDFDACVLGMGTDGHFASLFPGAEGLSEALNPGGRDNVVTIRPDPMPADAPYSRISLTLKRLLASRHCMLLLRGDEKREVLERAVDGAKLPIAALLQHAGPELAIHWSP